MTKGWMMSDVSKTNELIAEAADRLRKYYEAGEMIHMASSYRTGDGVTHIIDFEDLRTVVEAATRVPVQEESNDDREALHVSPAIQAVREYLDQLEDWEAQNYVIEELRSLVDDIPCCETATAMPHEEHARATVPDAATEQERDSLIELIAGGKERTARTVTS